MWTFLRAHLRAAALGLLAVAALSGWLGYRWLVTTGLPPILHAQLTELFGRDVSFRAVDTNLRTHFTVSDVTVGRTRDPASDRLFAMKRLVIRFNIFQIFTNLRAPQRAVRRIDLVEPELEAPLEQIAPLLRRRGGGQARRARAEADTGALPAVPKSYLKIENAAVTVTRRGVPVLGIRRFNATLDLRDFPAISGAVKAAIEPDASVRFEGSTHYSLKDFHGSLVLESLDLGRLSDLARMLDPGLPTRVGGRLDAKLELEGGWMSFDEFADHTTGHGTLRLQGGSLELRGTPLITGADTEGSLEGRQITLDRLSARVLSGDLRAAGSLGNLGTGRLRLKGALENVPVRALRALSPGLPEELDGVFSFGFSATGTGEAPVFMGRLSSPGLGVPGARPEHILAEMTYTYGAVDLTNLSASMWGGAFRGAGAVTGLQGGDPAVRFDLEGRGFDVTRSPIGARGYGGTASLRAVLAGPPRALTGTLDARVAGVTARGLPAGDLTASARFEAGVVSVRAKTDAGTFVISGDLILPGGLAYRDVRLEVNERLPVILAISGVAPHPEFEGRARGVIRLEGTSASPLVTADIAGSGLRLGRVTIADAIRIPRFMFRDLTLAIPEDAPARLEWGDRLTTLEVSGAVPVGAFTAEGQHALRLAVSVQGGLSMLERLDLVRKAEGTFRATLRLGGTSARPVWEYAEAWVEGGRLALKDPVFDRDFEGWNLAVVVRDDEGEVRDGWFALDRQRQTLAGRFAMRGWRPESVELTTRTTALKAKHLRGLPLAIEDVAEIRVLLDATVAQRPGERGLVLTGPDPEKGAELTLQDGTITWAGPRIGEGGGAASATRAGESGWWDRLSFIGRVAIGRNVTYAPRSAASKSVTSFWKLLTGDREGFRKGIGQYASRTGMLELVRQQALGFDLRIRDGSSIKMVKEAHDGVAGSLRAHGEVALDPGGKVTMGPIAFTLPDEPRLKHRIEFPGGEKIEAHLNLIAETTLYDKRLTTPAGEAATVEELNIRLVLSPPGPLDDKLPGALQYKFELVSDPEKVNGEVTVAAPAGGETEPSAGPQTRPVSFTPDKGSLMLALFGLDSLAAAGPGTTAGTGTAGQEIATSAATGILNAVLNPIRKLLRLDVLSVRKSELAKRRRPSTSAAATANAPGTAGAGGSQIASALENTELTAGVALPYNLFLNQHVILLDASRLTSQTTSSLTAQRSSPTGFITELEFRRSSFKIKTKGRWFGLPDDPVVDRPFELFGGLEVNQEFRGISSREPFIW